MMHYATPHLETLNHGGKLKVVNINQGECFVSDDPNVCITTILGSCVATCLWDPIHKVGGMNHYLLPGDTNSKSQIARYGVNAIELLINGLLKMGCKKQNLVAKIFGGAQMIATTTNIGDRNSEFAHKTLLADGIQISGGSVGGLRGRRLRFFPTTGLAQQRLMLPNELPIEVVRVNVQIQEKGGDLELF